jgi:hypothetical protein
MGAAEVVDFTAAAASMAVADFAAEVASAERALPRAPLVY